MGGVKAANGAAYRALNPIPRDGILGPDASCSHTRGHHEPEPASSAPLRDRLGPDPGRMHPGRRGGLPDAGRGQGAGLGADAHRRGRRRVPRQGRRFADRRPDVRRPQGQRRVLPQQRAVRPARHPGSHRPLRREERHAAGDHGFDRDHDSTDGRGDRGGGQEAGQKRRGHGHHLRLRQPRPGSAAGAEARPSRLAQGLCLRRLGGGGPRLCRRDVGRAGDRGRGRNRISNRRRPHRP